MGSRRPNQAQLRLRSLDLLGISARGSDAAQPPQLVWECSELGREIPQQTERSSN